MQYKDINKIFSDAVAKKLAEGFTICTNTMSGTQGEIAFVNFVKDGEHYTLMLDKESGHWREDIFLDAYVICWAKSKELKGDFKDGKHVTFWRGDKYVDVISKQKFYIVADRGNYFVQDEAEAKRICDIRKKHWKFEEPKGYFFEFEIPMNSQTRKLAAHLWRKHRGRYQKAVKQGDINSAKLVRDGSVRRLYVNNQEVVLSV